MQTTWSSWRSLPRICSAGLTLSQVAVADGGSRVVIYLPRQVSTDDFLGDRDGRFSCSVHLSNCRYLGSRSRSRLRYLRPSVVCTRYHCLFRALLDHNVPQTTKAHHQRKMSEGCGEKCNGLRRLFVICFEQSRPLVVFAQSTNVVSQRRSPRLFRALLDHNSRAPRRSIRIAVCGWDTFVTCLLLTNHSEDGAATSVVYVFCYPCQSFIHCVSSADPFRLEGLKRSFQ